MAARSIASVLWLTLCSVAAACAPPDGWSVPPPECEEARGASLVEDLVAWSRGGPGAPGVEDARDGGPVPFSDPRAYAEEDGLPVFHLYMAASLPDDEGYRPSRLVYRGRCHVIQARVRGDTSLRFPKRSFTLGFEDGQTFDEPSLAGGFTGRHKVVLVSPFNDNSYVRTRLAFSLWNRMSPDHLQVKTFSAVVYLNGRYHGLYTAVDHVDRHFLAAQGMDPGGELFKAVGNDANFSRKDKHGLPKLELHQGFEKKAGQPEAGDEAWRTVEALTAFVADSSAEDFRAGLGKWVNLADYEDWWIFAQLAFTADSVAKNAYHFRPRGAEARWRFIPWDLDASFGQHYNTVRLDPADLGTFVDENLLFARLLEDPVLSAALRERYRLLLQGRLHEEQVLRLIDEYAREVEPAARKDEARWGEEYRTFPRWSGRTDFTTFEGEVEYLRGWVRLRWDAVERSLR